MVGAPPEGGVSLAGPLPRRKSMGDDVYELLLGLLMNRRISPGARMSIDGLARELEVSPTPIREALTRLEAEGLVQKRPNRGYTAAPVLDDAGLENLFTMRALLEPAAAAAAATAMDTDTVGELGRIIQSMRRFVFTAGPHVEEFEGYRDFASQDAAFHNLIAHRSGNPLLAEAIVRLRPHMHLFRLYFVHGIASQTDAEHAAILAALAEGNGEAAQQAMDHHIARSRERMVRASRARGAGLGSPTR